MLAAVVEGTPTGQIASLGRPVLHLSFSNVVLCDPNWAESGSHYPNYYSTVVLKMEGLFVN